ncbi:MAG: cysteine hydrolase family protein [Shewanella sp.]
MFNSNNPALIIIDVQDAIDSFSDFERNNLDAEVKISNLLANWRKKKLPVIHVRHSSKFTKSPYHISSPLVNFKADVAPLESECVITKQENCAFIETELEQILQHNGVSELIICGVLTNHSVDVSVRVAAALGFKVFVPSDATAAYGMKLLNGKVLSALDTHQFTLSVLSGEYCTLVTSGQLIASNSD